MANPRRLNDSLADARKRKRQKRQQRIDRDFVSWAHTRYCYVCGVYGVEWHHEPFRSKPDWSDRSGLPLCAEHHRGGSGRHMLGRKGFEEKYGLVLAVAVTETYVAYQKETSPADEGGDLLEEIEEEAKAVLK